MVARIRGLGAKKLSYAGRVTLINAVLNTLQNYWAQMFIIPKSIINHIMAICRNYLWNGSTIYQRVPLVAWDKVTMPKKEGGLGIRRADTWNIATVGKLVDWIYCKADALDQMVKEKLKNGYEDGSWNVNPKGYSIRNGYDWLSPDHPQLDWPAIVWNNWNVPKHSMTTWLRMHEGMNVKSKLVRYGCCADDLCLLCQLQPENVEHLFNTCVYTVKVQACLVHWFDGCFPTMTGLIATKRDSAQWKIKVAMFNAITYSIWYQRNNARINDCVVRPEVVAERIEEEVRRRIKRKSGNVADGIRSLNIRVAS
ncbi:uncharacterized protein LOC141649375 [Silene latifolia]|uniref:uncharacterized protein LOC141649375 n=1 Tax=Silene latifolia TaxID=37657 RepID=UPI003D778214